MSFPFILQGNNVTVVIGNKPHTISRTHITYQKVVDAIKQGEWDKVADLIEPKKVVLNYGKGNVSVQGETLYWKGKPMHNALANRMISMLQDEFPIEPLVNFMENLMTNPSKQAVQELYGFLEKNNLPITPDGCFLAYKRVREDYKDIHSGTMLNAPGCTVEMERNEVDDNRNNTCSTGLHFCSESYLKSFSGARTVIVKINPSDVVSIPSDYNDAKGRACRYEVVGEVGVNPEDEQEFTQPVQANANNNTYVAPKPVVNAPKTGSSAFYRGYTDGYDGKEYDNKYHGRDYTNYDEGFDKGVDDKDWDDDPRYQYVIPVQPARNPDGSWPFPGGKR